MLFACSFPSMAFSLLSTLPLPAANYRAASQNIPIRNGNNSCLFFLRDFWIFGYFDALYWIFVSIIDSVFCEKHPILDARNILKGGIF